MTLLNQKLFFDQYFRYYFEYLEAINKDFSYIFGKCGKRFWDVKVKSISNIIKICSC